MQHAKKIALIPVFNEEDTLLAVLNDTAALVDQIIIVEDGSRDASREMIREWMSGREGVHLLGHAKNLGMAMALRSGFLFADRLMRRGEIAPSDILINLDADGQHPLHEIPAATREILAEDLDILLVSRDFSLYPLYKRLGNRFLTSLARFLTGFPYKDVESGFRFIRMRSLPLILRYFTGWKYSCAQEIAIITALQRLKIRNDYPVRINYYRPGTTFMDGFAVATMSLVALIRVKIGWQNSAASLADGLRDITIESGTTVAERTR